LADGERAALNPNAPDLAMAKGSLAGLGAIDADVVVCPSPSSAATFEGASEFSFRASDQPVVSIRFGCDEAPFDPATDPALSAPFSAGAPTGRVDCRKALARRTSLALGPRTLLLATAPLDAEAGGRALVTAVSGLARDDVAVVVPAAGDRALPDEIKLLAIETPGKIAVFPESGPAADRQILAGADAVLLADGDNHSGRMAGHAMRYGALPLAPDSASYRDHLVDVDVASRTGTALLYQSADAYESISVVQRAAALRGNPDFWQDLQVRLMRSAPTWAATATLFESLCLSQ
jgi:starch synthase